MTSPEQEFDRQVETLVERGYPEASRLAASDFAERLAPLRDVVAGVCTGDSVAGGSRVPFVLVPGRQMVSSQDAMERVRLGAASGLVALTPKVPTDFLPISPDLIPTGDAYLVLGVETGTEYLNMTPALALQQIQQAGRSPLTMEEGIALVTQFPQMLKKNACFSLSGSRAGDKRVPAIWISDRCPKLGWCWEGNPHTWLGSASCASRAGAN